jgi:hypothetical protein
LQIGSIVAKIADRSHPGYHSKRIFAAGFSYFFVLLLAFARSTVNLWKQAAVAWLTDGKYPGYTYAGVVVPVGCSTTCGPDPLTIPPKRAIMPVADNFVRS